MASQVSDGVAEWPRRVLAGGVIGLTLVAFAGSLAHTHATIVEFGQTGWVAAATALAPEATVALSVLRIRHGGDPRQVRWAWLLLVTNAAFTVWGNLEQAKGIDLMPPRAGALIVAVWLAWAAIGAAGLIDIRERHAKVAPSASARASRSAATSTATGPSAGGVPVARQFAAPRQEPRQAPAEVAAAVGVPGGAVAKHRDAAAGRSGTPRAAAMADALRLAGERGGVLPEKAELVDLGHAPRTVDRALAALRAGQGNVTAAERAA